MAETTVIAGRRSPAQHLAEAFAAAEVTGPRAVALREVGFQTMIGLRVSLGTPAAGRVTAELGTELPSVCGAVTTGPGCAVLWLSPDEFLVLAGSVDATELTTALVGALAGDPWTAAVDLSANRTTFELTGAAAREVLEKGCPLDLHPRAFPVGTAYVTRLGPVPILLWRTGDDSYQILPRSSYADFLGRWVLDAMAEFAAPGIGSE